jgi:AbiV family abortive infection protein
LDEKEKLEGAMLATQNGRSLYECAKMAQASGHFGCATSLYILCAEECAKAIYLGLINAKASAKIDSKIFRNHKSKHEIAAHQSSLLHQIFGLTNEPTAGHPPHGECGILERIEGWRRSADELKKSGFYVDHTGPRWRSPSQITQEQMDDSEFQAHTLLQLAEIYFSQSV